MGCGSRTGLLTDRIVDGGADVGTVPGDASTGPAIDGAPNDAGAPTDASLPPDSAPLDGAGTDSAPPSDGGIYCDPAQGTIPSGGVCVPIPAPRPIAPLSTAVATSQSPTFRWALSGVATGAHVQICKDRACNVVLTAFDANGSSGRPAGGLPPGLLFWRLFGRASAVDGIAPSPTWELRVGHRSAGDASWGALADVNGDGHGDLFVGQREIGTSPSSGGVGHVFEYLGGAQGVAAPPTTTLAGPAANDLFGHALGSGDVDGDGYADLLVGAPGNSTTGGSVLVYRGGAGGVMPSSMAALAAPMGGAYGSSLGFAGDVDGDGYGDAVVGAPYAGGPANSFPGAAYVHLGSQGGLASSPSITFTRPSTVTDFGFAVAGIGDVNGDGWADVAVAGNEQVPLDSGGIVAIPHVFVFLGSAAGLSASAAFDLDGPPHNYTSSNTITLAGPADVDGDGYADLVAASLGRLIVYFGSATGLSPARSAYFIVPGLSEYDYSFRVGSGGDLDGDGYDDIVASYTSLYVYRGGPGGLPPTPSQTLTPPNGSATIYGYFVAAAGDVDGDTLGDLAVGAPFDLGWNGRAYLYLGAPGGIATSPQASLMGTASTGTYQPQFGSAVE